ncbi:MAG: Holliday junction branch migration protein RuvA, partial [Candidatus Bipolaricaulota bacterium]
QERELFRLILGVSRIGPKTALRILSSMREEEFREAVVNEEVQILTSIKGVGKKTARRLILELKDKIPEIEVADGAGVEGKSRVGLALQALTSDSLGFSRMEAREALSSVQGEDRDLEVQELIQRALKELS